MPEKNLLFYKTGGYGLATCLCLFSASADVLAARIIANAPLRAKEASPFSPHKYPVIVRSSIIKWHWPDR
jgi:hypothetical protein